MSTRTAWADNPSVASTASHILPSNSFSGRGCATCMHRTMYQRRRGETGRLRVARAYTYIKVKFNVVANIFNKSAYKEIRDINKISQESTE